MTRPEGRTRFQDGMRVASEHLDHLQALLLDSLAELREAAGAGKVAYGLRVEAAGPGAVRVSEGVAFDGLGRRLDLAEPRDVPLDVSAGPRWLAAAHVLRSEGLVDGVPTLLSDDVELTARQTPPPWADGAVAFAVVTASGAGPEIVQRGEWFLPPLGHGHTGAFTTRGGRWRYDGDAVGGGAPVYDSGFVPVDPGTRVDLRHGLGSADLAVQLQARRGGVVTIEGLGTAWWYELPDDRVIRLARGASGGGPLELRACAWPLSGVAPVLPVADPGAPFTADPGLPFSLDGSGSRAFGGRRIRRYVWTLLS